jgi:phage terminase large subunit-like protein
MARPSKSLVEHVRDGTFRPDRHANLLLGPLVKDKKLRGLQLAYRDASEASRRGLALEFAEAARRTNGSGPPKLSEHHDGESVAQFFRKYFRHTKGAKAGEPFELEPWQRAFVDEFYRRDENGRRIYRLGVLGIPRGNGKSPLAAGLAIYELATRKDSPDVFTAAASKDQGRIVFDFARSFVESGDLHQVVKTGRNELIYEEHLGVMRVLSADGALQHGLSVSCAIVDELHAFTTPKQEELYTALASALHKRLDSFMLVITTAGADTGSLLGKMCDAARAELALERRGDALTVGRDEENGVLFWWYQVPEGADLEDEDLWRASNPASWVDLRDLRRQRHAPGFSEAAFRRLHLNQFTAGEEVWIDPALWQTCKADDEIPDGAQVYIGVDASFSNDATAVSWAHKTDDGNVILRCHVWSAIKDTEAHTWVPGGRIDLGAVEDFITELGQRYLLREVVYDPAFFARSAEILFARGFVVALLDQRTREMREYTGQLYEAVGAGTLGHDGDPVLAAHVGAAAAQLDEFGGWRVKKRKQSKKIDGLVASVIAHGRAARAPVVRPFIL